MDTYIRMVYSGTSSGMNAHLWEPWFDLPTICDLLRALELDTCMTDSGIGELFLNFMLEERCARLAGLFSHAVIGQKVITRPMRNLFSSPHS
jgi:hypothetical protein